MKTKIQKTMFLWAAAVAFPVAAEGQDKVEASVGADLVSSYIWRGQELGDVSIQPSVSLSWKGLSLTVWGSASWGREYAKEFDLTLGYAVKGFSVSVTDYSFSKGTNFKTGTDISGKYFHFGSNSTLHVYEAQVGYDFGFLAVNWYTNIGGNDGLKKDGKRAYSSYVSLSAPFRSFPLGRFGLGCHGRRHSVGDLFLQRRQFGLCRVRGSLAGGQGDTGDRVVCLALVCPGYMESGVRERLFYGRTQFLSITEM